MSIDSDQWRPVVEFCLARGLGVIPGGFEPWLSFEAVAVIVGREVETVRRRGRGLPRHPVFTGFVRLSSYSGAAADGEAAEA